MTAKVCNRCEELKPLSAFSPNRRAKDGLQWRCRSCAIEIQREWRRRNPVKHREQRRRYGLRHPEALRAQRRRDRKRWADRNREQVRANQAVANATRDGRLMRPPNCERCGGNDRIEGHHPDYNKPLEVEWLCFTCHRQNHGQLLEVA